MADKNDRRNKKFDREKCTVYFHRTIDNEAWRNLSITAQAMFPVLKLQWRGNNANNNGQLSISYRQLANIMGIKSLDTIGSAFKDLQSKGFVCVHKNASLGVKGYGKTFEFEITDIALPGSNKPRRLFLEWTPGNDFEVMDAATHNPSGRSMKSNPCPKKWDDPVPLNRMKTTFPSQKSVQPVLKSITK